MSDEDALLSAIRAHPDEDTPRLIYADWLQENGQPERAEFIRLQHISEFERTAEQGRRHDQLEREFRQAWLAHLPPANWWFVRGMPETLCCDAAEYINRFLELSSDIFIYELILGKIEAHLADVMQRGWPASVAKLLLACAPNPFGRPDRTWMIEEIAGCDHLADIRELCLRGFDVSEVAAQALVASPHLTQVAFLDLNECALDLEAIRLLERRFGLRFRHNPKLPNPSQDVTSGIDF